MGKRFLIGAGYGVMGLVVAIALTMGAYAMAGRDLSQPARPIGAGNPLAPAASSSSPSAHDRAVAARERRRERIRERIRERKAALRQKQLQKSNPGPLPNTTSTAPASPASGGSDDHHTDDSDGSDDHHTDD